MDNLYENIAFAILLGLLLYPFLAAIIEGIYESKYKKGEKIQKPKKEPWHMEDKKLEILEVGSENFLVKDIVSEEVFELEKNDAYRNYKVVKNG